MKSLSKYEIDVTSLRDDDLLHLRSIVEKEARRRGLFFSVGEFGEKLVIELFRKRSDLPVLEAAPRGTKNVDALSRDGERYSIKTLQHARKTGTIYPDSVDPNRPLFEYLVVALLDDALCLERVVLLSWDQFCEVRSWDKRMNAWYVARSKRALDAGRQIFPVQEMT